MYICNDLSSFFFSSFGHFWSFVMLFEGIFYYFACRLTDPSPGRDLYQRVQEANQYEDSEEGEQKCH